MVVDNFKKIGDFLEFEEGKFYYLQIIRRKSDRYFVGSSVLRSYRIERLEQLKLYKKEIITMCEAFGARAYIDVCRRSYERTALQTLKKASDYLYGGQYPAMASVFERSIMLYQDTKFWVIDIDTDDDEFINGVVDKIDSCHSGYDNNVVLIVPTVQGAHAISRPFNTVQLGSLVDGELVTIHKNRPTLLYCNLS